MATRNVYLKIERIPDYSPVAPDMHVSPPIMYARDCMRNMGHEDGKIPDDEVAARRLTALIYREYLDPQYLVPKPDKLIAADVNEPPFTRRVPGTVIYARPGDRLRIHVKNGDVQPHSFHLHGLRYGIDSDGSLLSLPKTSSRVEILAVREIISHSARSSGASLFRWFASHLWSSSPFSFCSSGA